MEELLKNLKCQLGTQQAGLVYFGEGFCSKTGTEDTGTFKMYLLKVIFNT